MYDANAGEQHSTAHTKSLFTTASELCLHPSCMKNGVNQTDLPSKEKYLAEQQAVSYPAFPLTYLKLESSGISTGGKECLWLEFRVAGNYIRNVKCSFVHWMVFHLKTVMVYRAPPQPTFILDHTSPAYYCNGFNPSSPSYKNLTCYSHYIILKISYNILYYDQVLAIFMLQPPCSKA